MPASIWPGGCLQSERSGRQKDAERAMPGVRTVLVTGVSGHPTGAMADRLAAGGLRVRAMVRTPDHARMAAQRRAGRVVHISTMSVHGARADVHRARPGPGGEPVPYREDPHRTRVPPAADPRRDRRWGGRPDPLRPPPA